MTRLKSRKTKNSELLNVEISKLSIVWVIAGLFVVMLTVVAVLDVISYWRDTPASRIRNWNSYEEACQGQVYIAVNPPWLAKYMGHSPFSLEASAFTSPTDPDYQLAKEDALSPHHNVILACEWDVAARRFTL